MDNWRTYTHPDLPLTLSYPNPTPLGYPVRIDERSTETSFRAHLVSEGSDEVYFEVGIYRSLPIREAVQAFLQDVTGRIEGLEIREERETLFAGYPGRQLDIHWPGKERVILFIERGDTVYRIIRDPKSNNNQRILDSFRFV